MYTQPTFSKDLTDARIAEMRRQTPPRHRRVRTVLKRRSHR